MSTFANLLAGGIRYQSRQISAGPDSALRVLPSREHVRSDTEVMVNSSEEGLKVRPCGHICNFIYSGG